MNVGRNSTTLGPFLTWLLLVLAQHSQVPRDATSHGTASELDPSGRDARCATRDNGLQPAPGHHRRLSLGPFATLILTLHCSGRNDVMESHSSPEARLLSDRALFISPDEQRKLGSAIPILLAENAHPAGGREALETALPLSPCSSDTQVQ